MESNEFILLSSLKPVNVDGFQVSFGAHGGDIWIKREGRRCKHYFLSRDRIRNTSDYESVIKEAFADFIKTAKVGGGQRKDYISYYWRGESNADAAAAWRDYTKAYKGLRRIDPAGYKALIS